MSRFLKWMIVVLAIVLAFVLYDRWSRKRLHVTPEAQREIDKAKER
jgi:hypothetical protein